MKQFSHFEIAVTNYCQAKCPSCNRTNEETLELNPWIDLVHFDFDVFKKAFTKDFAVRNKLKTFKFCGEVGDPMMHPRIDDFIDHGFSIGASEILIATNGGLRQPAWYKKMALSHARKLCIIFGIDGTDGETNNKYRIGVNTERAFENMLTFKHHGGNAKWQFIIFDFNYHQIPTVFEKCKEWNIPPIFIWNQGKYGMVNPENREAVEREYMPIIDEAKNYAWKK